MNPIEREYYKKQLLGIFSKDSVNQMSDDHLILYAENYIKNYVPFVEPIKSIGGDNDL